MATTSVGESVLEFSVTLYKQLMPKEQQNGNVFFSPFSISAALSMALGGARNNTAKELSTVLHVDDQIHEQFAGFIRKLSDGVGGAKLDIANRMYAEQTFPVLSSYQSLLRENYNATIESVDFRNKYDSVRREVNSWVEKATESKIKDLLPSGSVDALTTLVLVNAICFKGLWSSQFDSKLARTFDFHLDSKNTTQVQMMYQKSSYSMSSSDELGVEALEVPYLGGKTSMVVLLPNDVEGLPRLEERLSTSALSKILRNLHVRSNVTLLLPKFKLEHDVCLKKALEAMGIKDFFGPEADLSAISGTGNLVPTEVVHKAFVEVNEEGTEAAAATAVPVMCRSARVVVKEYKFVVDRPLACSLSDAVIPTLYSLWGPFAECEARG